MDLYNGVPYMTWLRDPRYHYHCVSHYFIPGFRVEIKDRECSGPPGDWYIYQESPSGALFGPYFHICSGRSANADEAKRAALEKLREVVMNKSSEFAEMVKRESKVLADAVAAVDGSFPQDIRFYRCRSCGLEYNAAAIGCPSCAGK